MARWSKAMLKSIKNRKERWCANCGEISPINNFHKDKANADKRRPYCKLCEKKIGHQKYLRNKAKVAVRTKQYRKTVKGKLSRIKERENYMKFRPIRYRTRTITRNAIRAGILKCKPCEKCGAKKVEAHHPNYNEPLNIMWFCRTHHRDWHRHNIPIYPVEIKPPRIFLVNTPTGVSRKTASSSNRKSTSKGNNF